VRALGDPERLREVFDDDLHRELPTLREGRS
jgi:hypothetical protein